MELVRGRPLIGGWDEGVELQAVGLRAAVRLAPGGRLGGSKRVITSG